MKAFSVRQPFAMFIANRMKTLEIKPKRTNYRGKILICSSKKIYEGNCIVNRSGHGIGLVPCEYHYSMLTMHHTQPSAKLGYAIAIADLVDCREMENTESDKLAARHEFVPDSYVWVLENVKKITPFPVTGKLGIFEVDFEAEKRKMNNSEFDEYLIKVKNEFIEAYSSQPWDPEFRASIDSFVIAYDEVIERMKNNRSDAKSYNELEDKMDYLYREDSSADLSDIGMEISQAMGYY